MDELVKILRACGDSNNSCGNCPVRENDGSCPHGEWEFAAEKYMLQAADALEDLSMKLHGDEAAIAGMKREIERMVVADKLRWIPVTERLPECDLGAEVGNIEWISCGMVHAGCFGRGGKYRDAYFRTWTDAGEGMDAKDADYWRAVTIPQPPKEEKNND